MLISPKTKIGELLKEYPQLEDILIKMSPAFEKLKNPILRRTVAKVATIQQISIVGNIPVDEIVKRLRVEVGQPVTEENTETGSSPSEQPPWFIPGNITSTFNATPLINAGESPMSEILSLTKKLNPGDIMALHTPFIPAPIIDMLKQKNYTVWSVHQNDEVISYITLVKQ